MWSSGIVALKIALYPGPRLRDARVSTQIDFFALDFPPKPFDKNIVPLGSLAVHVDLDAGILQCLGKVY